MRDAAAGARVAAALEAELPPESGTLTVAHLDLADRSAVGTFVADRTGPLHILVGNAGVVFEDCAQAEPVTGRTGAVADQQ
ncbi:hypothetical protein ACFZCP_07890 [Streptomyces sp. NPDC007971]|uniref:hypothetical protein n=1 Tax=Streptomyces sp. NPDC007971 TaxID=3364799 RepID=UPI0036E59BDD